MMHHAPTLAATNAPFAMRLLALLLLLVLASAPRAEAQALRSLPFDLTVEGGLGFSTIRWEGEAYRRWSHLPEVTVAVGASHIFARKIIVEPKLGLHFDEVSFSAIEGYRDRYRITSLRTGLFVLATSDTTLWDQHLIVGFGLEAWRPLHVRGRAFSRTGDGRAWTWLPDPAPFDGWKWYWTFRIGLRDGRWASYLDFSNDHGRQFLPGFFLPDNPMDYFSLRLGFQRKL